MKIKQTSIYLSCFLIAVALASCEKEETGIIEYKAEPKTETGAKLVNNTDLIATVFSDTTYSNTPGLKTTEMAYFSKKGYAMRVFIFEVDLTNPKITVDVGKPINPTNPLKHQAVTEQALKSDVVGHMVWGGTNANFNNVTTGVPYGLIYENGTFIQNPVPDYPNFFVITKDKKALIGSSPQHTDAAFNSKIWDAVGGGVLVLKSNIIVPQTEATPSVNPRTCVGVSADGNKVFIMAVDGRQYHWSNGMTYEELAKFMSALGASDALNLDGGGSTTFVTRTSPDFTNPNRFKVLNWPSDNGGQPRDVGNTLLIVSN